MPPEVYETLRLKLDQVKTIYSTFANFQETDRIEEAYDLAISKYFYPRLEVVVLLLSSVDENKFRELTTAVNAFAIDCIMKEGWRLGSTAKDDIEFAWTKYKDLALHIINNLQAFSGFQGPTPYNFLMTATRMDFSLTTTLMYLDGEFPDANRNALSFLCSDAKSTCLALERDFMALLSKRQQDSGEREHTLRNLYGSWESSEHLDMLLKDIYNSRD